MKFVPVWLADNPDEIHTYLHARRVSLPSLGKAVKSFHWSALRRAAALITPCGGSAIEVGCGEGYLIPSLAQHFDQVVALDRSEQMLASARQNFSQDNVTFVHADVCRLEPSQMPRKSFDWVVCLEVLEHVQQWDSALHNMVNLLAPGGRMLISLPVEIGVPLLIKEVGRRSSYRHASGWRLKSFILKVLGRRVRVTRRYPQRVCKLGQAV